MLLNIDFWVLQEKTEHNFPYENGCRKKSREKRGKTKKDKKL